jgi:hypothetical protein
MGGMIMGWYQPGSTSLVGGARYGPAAIITAQNLVNNNSVSSVTTNVTNFPVKTLTVTVTHTGTISNYLLKVTALSARDDVAANYAEIVSEIYQEDGIYHWNIEDNGAYFRVDIKSFGTADNANYITVTIDLEGSV